MMHNEVFDFFVGNAIPKTSVGKSDLMTSVTGELLDKGMLIPQEKE